MPNTDDHHDESYEDTGEIISHLASVAYGDWLRPGEDKPRPPEELIEHAAELGLTC